MTPPPNQPPAGEWAVLATVSTASQAEAMRMDLELNGIRVEIDGQITANVIPIISGAFGGIPVRVPAADLKRAREALANRMRPRERGIYECPACRSDNVHHLSSEQRLAPLMLLACLFFPPLFFFLLYVKFANRNREEYQCRKCGHFWDVTQKRKSPRRFLRA